MTRDNLGVVLVCIAVVGMLAWFSQRKAPVPVPVTNTSGAYQYHCDNGVQFTMTPSEDANSLHIEASGTGSYPPSTVLPRTPAESGARFEGNGVIFTAKGETVWLTSGSSTITCSPDQVPDEAPYNFGD